MAAVLPAQPEPMMTTFRMGRFSGEHGRRRLLARDRGPEGTRGQTGLPASFRQKAPEIHGSLVSPRRPVLLVFVPLEAGRIDAGDVGTAILVEVHHGACRGAHASVVQIAARPVPGGGVVAVEIDATRLSAEAGDDFVHAIAFQN